MPFLDMTADQYDEIKTCECVLVHQYRREEDGEVMRAWVEKWGTREECQEELDHPSTIFVVPNGLRIEGVLVDVEDLSEPTRS